MTNTIESSERGITLPSSPEVDDVTRREFLIGAAGLMLLPAACNSGEEGEGTRASGDTRTIRHASGETEVPAKPRRTVSLTSVTELDGLLTLGVDLAAAAADDADFDPDNPMWLGCPKVRCPGLHRHTCTSITSK